MSFSRKLERKQVYLDPGSDKRLKEWAARKGVSEAFLIREAVNDYLAKLEQRDPDGTRQTDPLRRLVGMYQGGIPADLAIHHDQYLRESEDDPVGKGTPEGEGAQ